MNLNISCDIDGCLCDFYSPYIERFGEPKKDGEITKNVVSILSKDKSFWINLPKINTLNWTPKQYTTARTIRKQWIKEYLDKEGFPEAPVYQIFGYKLSKYHHIKAGGCNLHIDDSISVFIDLNLKGIPCLLYDNPSNRGWGPIGRILTLDIEEIEDCYRLYMDTIFPYFKEIFKEYE